MGRWFVAGAAGMLGQDLCAVLESAGHTVTRADLPGLDILDPAQCTEQVAGHDVVVNSAAYTAVDAAETDDRLGDHHAGAGGQAALKPGQDVRTADEDRRGRPGEVMHSGGDGDVGGARKAGAEHRGAGVDPRVVAGDDRTADPRRRHRARACRARAGRLLPA